MNNVTCTARFSTPTTLPPGASHQIQSHPSSSHLTGTSSILDAVFLVLKFSMSCALMELSLLQFEAPSLLSSSYNHNRSLPSRWWNINVILIALSPGLNWSPHEQMWDRDQWRKTMKHQAPVAWLTVALIVRHHRHLTLIITLNTLSSPALPSHLLDIISPSMDAATHIWMRAFAAADVILRITPNTKHQTIITSTTKIWSSTAVSNTRILKYVRHRSSCIRSGEIWAALKMYETYISQ